MKIKSKLLTVTTVTALAALAIGVALAAQDRYTLKVPGGLAF